MSKVKYIDQTDLAIKAKAGDSAAKTRLVNLNKNFVMMIARHYQGQGMDFDDLVQEGYVGLLKAIEMYNPKLGNKFLTYAGWWMRQAILSALAEQTRQIRLPANRIYAIEKYRKIKSTLSQTLQRDPSQDEIFELMNSNSETNLYETYGISYSKNKNVDGDPGLVLDQLLAPEQELPDKEMLADSLKQELQLALKKLRPKEREVIQMCYGLGMYERAYTLGEIGDKLGLTRERIRQIKHHALRVLRRLNRRKQLESLKN